MSSVAPIVLPDREGEHLWFDGGLLTFKATGAHTAGALLLLEVLQPEGKTPPLHVHPEADETFYVLEGELVVHIDGPEHSVREGAVLVVPRGTPHTFVVTSQTARILLAFTPASAVMEDFVRRASQPATDPTLTAPPPDSERYKAAAERSGLKVLGPSPFEAHPPAAAATSGTERVDAERSSRLR
jgi:quercetin dioxygenase-like cupin family protein